MEVGAIAETGSAEAVAAGSVEQDRVERGSGDTLPEACSETRSAATFELCATRCTPPQPAKSTRTACACDTKRIARTLSANGEGSRSWSISSLSFPLYLRLSDPYLPLPQISPFAPLQYPSGNHHVSVVLTGCRRPLPAGLRSRLSRSDGRAVPNRSTPISSRSWSSLASMTCTTTLFGRKYMQVQEYAKRAVLGWPRPDDLAPSMRAWAALPPVRPVTRKPPKDWARTATHARRCISERSLLQWGKQLPAWRKGLRSASAF